MGILLLDFGLQTVDHGELDRLLDCAGDGAHPVDAALLLGDDIFLPLQLLHQDSHLFVPTLEETRHFSVSLFLKRQLSQLKFHNPPLDGLEQLRVIGLDLVHDIHPLCVNPLVI